MHQPEVQPQLGGFKSIQRFSSKGSLIAGNYENAAAAFILSAQVRNLSFKRRIIMRNLGSQTKPSVQKANPCPPSPPPPNIEAFLAQDDSYNRDLFANVLDVAKDFLGARAHTHYLSSQRLGLQMLIDLHWDPCTYAIDAARRGSEYMDLCMWFMFPVMFK